MSPIEAAFSSILEPGLSPRGRSRAERATGAADDTTANPRQGPAGEVEGGVGRTDRATDQRVKAYGAAAARLAAAAGRDSADNPEEVAALNRLKEADAAVRAHEAAHVAAGGSHVRGGATYTYETGPDGRQYAVAGEVQIDVSPVKGNPQATIQKMATVRAAALAPSDPSAADRAVAAAAAQAEAAARAELSQMKAEEGEGNAAEAGGKATQSNFEQAAAQITAAQAQQVQATYGAFAARQAPAQPAFLAAA